nr:uncharacterized protein LOC115260145 [Aedes albopictus]
MAKKDQMIADLQKQEENTVEFQSTLKPNVVNTPAKEVTGPDQSEDDDGDGYDTAAGGTDEEFTDSDDEATVNIGTPIEPRRSNRTTKGILPERYREVTSVTSNSVAEPRSYTEAIQCPE